MKNIPIKIFLIIIALFSTTVANTVKAEEISGKAHDFTLKSRAGKNIRLAELAGQVVLVNFWASWCGPCRKEMPKLESLHQKYKDLGVSILGINIDNSTELADKVLKDIKVNFPVLYDPEGNTSERYQVRAMPSTYLVDKKGNFRFFHKGYLPGYELEYDKQIKQLIRE